MHVATCVLVLYLEQIFISTSCSNVTKSIPFIINIICSDTLIIVTEGLHEKTLSIAIAVIAEGKL